MVETFEPRQLMSATYLPSTIASFDNATGSMPTHAITLGPNCTMYATTFQGGANGVGAIVAFPAGSGVAVPLYSFNVTDGANPQASLVFGPDGALYGNTQNGGANGDGTVFRFDLSSGTLTTLHDFNGTDGESSWAADVLDPSGELYGVADSGGNSFGGTLWKMNPANPASFTVITNFNYGTLGEDPYGDLSVDSFGNVFGTTWEGTSTYGGSVFELPAGANAITTLGTFDFNNTGGVIEGGVTIDADGNLYGTAEGGSGSTSNGTVWEIPAATHTLTTLAVFDGATTGASPWSGVVRDAAGDLFGTTISGGANNLGTAWEMPAGTTTIHDIYDLTGPNTYGTEAGIVIGSNGKLLLTTADGGANGVGSVIQLTPVVATHVVVTSQPANVVAGSSDSLVVQLEDGAGHLDTSDEGNVTLSIATGPAGASLGGTITVTAVDGIATFGNVLVTTAGQYTLNATQGGLTPGTTAAFTVTPGAATQLIVVQQPVGVAAGATIPVAVGVEDAYGNVVTNDSSMVTLSMATSPAGTNLDGTISQPAVNGVAVFSDLSVTRAGTYALSAGDGSLLTVTTASFAVSAGAASQLVIVGQPSGGTAGETLAQTAVEIEDAYGNLAVTSNLPVTLSVPVAAGGALRGSATAVSSNGVAVFSDLVITQAGTYTLTAASGGLPGSVSAPFNIVATTTVTPVPATVVAGVRMSPMTIRVAAPANTKRHRRQVVRISIESAPVGGKLFGRRWLIVRHGQVTFTALRMKVDGQYTLVAKDLNGDVLATQTIQVISNVARKLRFAVQPTVTGQPASATVQLRDRFGNVAASDDVAYLKLQKESGRKALLGGGIIVHSSTGVFVFTGLSVNEPGRYRLIARDGVHHRGVSAVFEVS